MELIFKNKINKMKNEKRDSNEEWITRQLEQRPRNLSTSLCGELRRAHDPWLPRANQKKQKDGDDGDERGAPPGALSVS